MGNAVVLPFLAGRARRKWMPAFEAGAVLSAIMAELWLWQGKGSSGAASTYLIVSCVMIAGWMSRGETLPDIGLVGFSFAVPAGMFVAWNLVVEELHLFPHAAFPARACLSVSWYAAWALAQEVVLNGFFATRLKGFIGGQRTVCAFSGAIFCLCHFPNPALAAAALVWGALSSYLFLEKRKSLYFLSAVHAAAGYAMILCLPHLVHWPHPMAVGRMFRW